MAPIPPEARALLESDALAHLVTLNPDGSPQVTCIWIGLGSAAVVFWVAGDFLTPVVRFASKATDPLVAPAWRVLDRAKARRRSRAASG